MYSLKYYRERIEITIFAVLFLLLTSINVKNQLLTKYQRECDDKTLLL